jgi:hypothetical protein
MDTSLWRFRKPTESKVPCPADSKEELPREITGHLEDPKAFRAGSEGRTLIFFVALNPVVTSDGTRAVFFALQIAFDAVAVNLGTPLVADHLHVTAHSVIIHSQ